MNRILKIAARRSRGGINRLVAVLLVLIAVMLVIIAIPSWKTFKYRSEKTACIQALKSARDGLIIEYLNNWEEGTVQDAMATLDKVMPARANICPAGGTVYLVRDDKGIYEPICGLHDDDTKLRVRLNASRAKDLLGEALRKARRRSEEEPESVEIKLNGKKLVCVRVQEEPLLRRGTATTSGYEGVVAFYGIVGDGDFAKLSGKAGEICYFIYADENHCAIWHKKDGWIGDSYQ